jgi:hypothetical protein
MSMPIQLYKETTTQFLARMILAVREGHQIGSDDAQRLQNMSMFGNGAPMPTMAEARTDASKPLDQKGALDLVTG